MPKAERRRYTQTRSIMMNLPNANELRITDSGHIVKRTKPNPANTPQTGTEIQTGSPTPEATPSGNDTDNERSRNKDKKTKTTSDDRNGVTRSNHQQERSSSAPTDKPGRRRPTRNNKEPADE